MGKTRALHFALAFVYHKNFCSNLKFTLLMDSDSPLIIFRSVSHLNHDYSVQAEKKIENHQKSKIQFQFIVPKLSRHSIFRSAALVLLNSGKNLDHVTNTSSDVIQAKILSLFVLNSLQRLHVLTTLLNFVELLTANLFQMVID